LRIVGNFKIKIEVAGVATKLIDVAAERDFAHGDERKEVGLIDVTLFTEQVQKIKDGLGLGGMHNRTGISFDFEKEMIILETR
jgi:hypothetical protein